MMTDIAGDATLLNHLFMVFAFANQIRNPLLFSLVIVEALSLKQTDYYCVAINCTHFVKLFLTWTTFSIALVTLLKNKRPQSYADLSEKNLKAVLTICLTNLIFTLTVFFTGFQINNFESKKVHVMRIMGPVTLITFCILLNIIEENNKILKTVEKRLKEVLNRISGKVNSVNPDIEVTQVSKEV